MRKVFVTVKVEVDLVVNMDDNADVQDALQSLDYEITEGRDSKGNFDLMDVEDVRVADYEVTDSK